MAVEDETVGLCHAGVGEACKQYLCTHIADFLTERSTDAWYGARDVSRIFCAGVSCFMCLMCFISWERSTEGMMKREFGSPEGTQRYYMIRKVKDTTRRKKLTWLMERMFFILKTTYMSRDNYGLIAVDGYRG